MSGLGRAAYEDKEEILRRLNDRVRRLEESGRFREKPRSFPPDSAKTNWCLFVVLFVLFFVGAEMMFLLTVAERPAALAPLTLFIAVAAAALGVMFGNVCSGKPGSYDARWLRWFTATGIFVAATFGVGALLAGAAHFIRG